MFHVDFLSVAVLFQAAFLLIFNDLRRRRFIRVDAKTVQHHPSTHAEKKSMH